MKNCWGKSALAVALCIAGLGQASAETATAADGLDGLTANDLLQLLVKEGVVSKEKLKELTDKIKTRERKQSEAAVEPVAAEQRDQKADAPSGVVRVPYIPTYVRDEIRDQVRVGLKEDVTKDVLAQAKTERWGMPGVTPEWVDRVKIYGDMRLRFQGDKFGGDNQEFSYANLNGINNAGKLSNIVDNTTDYYNTTDDRYRLRARLRLGLKAKITNTIEAGGRIVTGNQNEPGSANQTIGTYSSKYQTDFDLAYLSYKSIDKSIYVAGGRIINPFVSTDLIWHPDLTFEGIVGTWWMMRSDDIDSEFTQFDPFITAGVFPVSEENIGTDKWLYAAQAGFDYTFDNQSKFNAALTYYYYDHIRGERNDPDSFENNYTAPDYFQKGNSVFNITNSSDPNNDSIRYALLSDYHIADVIMGYDYAGFSPTHVILTADYLKNIGFDDKRASQLTNTKVDAKTQGWQVKAAVGWPVVQKRYDWQASVAYKYLERDAVVDAFTDSDFHLGGTDAKGYTLRFDYGVADSTVLTLRWMSTDEIDGKLVGYETLPPFSTSKVPLSVDTLQIDLNAKF